MTDYNSFIKDIWKAGGRAYLVGGWVRDKLLSRKSEDIDIEVIGIPRRKLEDILSQYGKYYRCGKTYEIYILSHDVEISYIEEDIDLKKLARRRDFTINSLYYNPITKETVDFFNGIKDIEAKLIRHIDEENFDEDPLRIIRATELASRLDFEIDSNTLKLMGSKVNLITNIPKERIVEELKKIYLLGERPSRAFLLLNSIGVFKYILPRMRSLQNVTQDKIYHPEGDVFTHILMMLDVLPRNKRSMDIFWAIIFHDMGKESTQPDFKDHALVSKKIFIDEGKNLVRDKKLRKTIEALIEYHEEPLKFLIGGFDRVKVKKLAVKVDLPKLLDLYLCDILGRGRLDNSQELKTIDSIKEIYEGIREDLVPLISGKDLLEWKLEDRRCFSEILRLLYEAQLEEKFINKDEAKVFFFSKIKGD